MKSRIILSLTALLLSVAAAYAQYDRISFRTDLSLNLSRGDYKLTGKTLPSKNLVGYRIYAGVDIPVMDVPVVGCLFVNPGLALQLKGADVSISDLQKGNGSALKENMLQSRFVSLVVPVNVGLHLPVSESIALSVYTGPYFSTNMSKTIRMKFVDGDMSYYKSELEGLKNSTLADWDMGWSAAATLGLSLFYVTAGIDLGFINTIKKSDVDATMRNVAYYFGAGIRL